MNRIDLQARFKAETAERRGNGFEYAVQRVIERFCPRGALALDIGASYGGHTYNLLAAVGPAGRVVAVEANPTVAETLSKWREVHANLDVMHAAVSDQVGEIIFRVPVGEGCGSIVPRADTPAFVSIKVPTTTVDTLAERQVGDLGFVKIDVEGAEMLVLDGAQATLRARRPLLAVEIDWARLDAPGNGGPFSREESLFGWLDRHGYDVLAVTGERLTRHDINAWTVFFVPREKFDFTAVAAASAEAVAEFLDMPPGWTLYSRFG